MGPSPVYTAGRRRLFYSMSRSAGSQCPLALQGLSVHPVSARGRGSCSAATWAPTRASLPRRSLCACTFSCLFSLLDLDPFSLPLKEYLFYFVYGCCVPAAGGFSGFAVCQVAGSRSLQAAFKAGSAFIHSFARKHSLTGFCRGLKLAAPSRIWPSVMFLFKMRLKTAC